MDFTASSFRHLLDVAVGMHGEVVSAPTVEGDTHLRQTKSEITICTILDLLHVSPHEENTSEKQPGAEDQGERKYNPPIHTIHKDPPRIHFITGCSGTEKHQRELVLICVPRHPESYYGFYLILPHSPTKLLYSTTSSSSVATSGVDVTSV